MELIVGGDWNNGSNAGVRAANANNSPGNANWNIGFRLANCLVRVAARPRPAASGRRHHTPIPRLALSRAKHKARRRQLVRQPNVGAGHLAMPHKAKYLYERIWDFGNLYHAWRRARLGKRFRPDVLEFSSDLGANLLALQEDLRALTWRPGAYRLKTIRDPKPRLIRIAPFRDRVVHQALCAVIGPIFERGWIHDSYACRARKGTHAAVKRLTHFLRRRGSAYTLKGDLRKYFDSIPHGMVMRELEWKISDARVLRLCQQILGTYESDFSGPAGFGPRGLPIGNLTSQWFANIVGDALDRFVKHSLRCRHYIRYMDDWLCLSDDKGELHQWLGKIAAFVGELGLVVHPKTRILASRCGVPFLGYKVWPDHRRVLRPKLVAGRRRMRRMIRLVQAGELDGRAAIARLRSWFSHLRQADTYGLRAALWREARPVLRSYLC